MTFQKTPLIQQGEASAELGIFSKINRNKLPFSSMESGLRIKALPIAMYWFCLFF